MERPKNFRTTGRLRGLTSDLPAAFKARLLDWEPQIQEAPGRLEIGVWGGLAVFAQEASGDRLELSAETEPVLRTLQEFFSDLLVLHGAEIAWSDVAEGDLAPNLAVMRVEAVTPRTPGFVRVRLSGPEAARFAVDGLHFRLLLPPAGRAPIWPRIGATGRTLWPEGEDALHRPVYTVVAQEADWLEFDVFRHARSPTCDWVDRDPTGEDVAIIGPGGGFLPEGDPVWLFGDETALPAVARILSLAQVEVRAWVRAAPEDLGDLAKEPRVERAPDLLEALKAAGAPPKGGHVWFAAGAQEAREARKHLLSLGLDKKAFAAMAYWS